MNKRVQILELDLRKIFSYAPEDTYPFPHKLLGLEKESALKIDRMDFSDTPIRHHCGFNFLKVLHFNYVGVTQEFLEYFLSDCPLLETLSVHHAINLVNLRVAGQSIALKHLTLLYCADLKSVQICDTNLVSFSFTGFLDIDLILSNVPLLVEVHYYRFYGRCIAKPLFQLSCCSSQLHSLMLNIYQMDYGDGNHVFPIFANLKHLELIAEAGCHRAASNLRFFLNASPYLQRLLLKLKHCDDMVCIRTPKSFEDTASCRHYNLKVVEVEGYHGILYDKQIMYLVKRAVSLEKIIVDPVQYWHWSNDDRDAKEVEFEVKARARAMKRLERKSPSTIEYVCM